MNDYRQYITKKEVLEAALKGEGCLGKAKDDEPVFVLRAQDSLAAEFVERWTIAASLGRDIDSHKLNAARAVRDAMQAWPVRKDPD